MGIYVGRLVINLYSFDKRIMSPYNELVIASEKTLTNSGHRRGEWHESLMARQSIQSTGSDAKIISIEAIKLFCRTKLESYLLYSMSEKQSGILNLSYSVLLRMMMMTEKEQSLC